MEGVLVFESPEVWQKIGSDQGSLYQFNYLLLSISSVEQILTDWAFGKLIHKGVNSY